MAQKQARLDFRLWILKKKWNEIKIFRKKLFKNFTWNILSLWAISLYSESFVKNKIEKQSLSYTVVEHQLQMQLTATELNIVIAIANSYTGSA